MNKKGLDIDFSWSVEQWLEVFRQFFDILIDFFDSIGIKLFKDAE